MSLNIKVVKKGDKFTNRVLAHDGATGLLVVDKDGVQEVADHPRVRQLISDGTVEEVKGGAASKPADSSQDAERKAAEEKAAAAKARK